MTVWQCAILYFPLLRDKYASTWQPLWHNSEDHQLQYVCFHLTAYYLYMAIWNHIFLENANIVFSYWPAIMMIPYIPMWVYITEVHLNHRIMMHLCIYFNHRTYCRTRVLYSCIYAKSTCFWVSTTSAIFLTLPTLLILKVSKPMLLHSLLWIRVILDHF